MARQAILDTDLRQHAGEGSADEGLQLRFRWVVALGVLGSILAWAAPFDPWPDGLSTGTTRLLGVLTVCASFLVAITSCSPRSMGRCMLALLAAHAAFPLLLVGIPALWVPPMGMVVAVYAFTFIAAAAARGPRRHPYLFATALAASCYLIFPVVLEWQLRVWPTFLA